MCIVCFTVDTHTCKKLSTLPLTADIQLQRYGSAAPFIGGRTAVGARVCLSDCGDRECGGTVITTGTGQDVRRVGLIRKLQGIRRYLIQINQKHPQEMTITLNILMQDVYMRL